MFTAIARAKLPIAANTAKAGSDPVKQINATFFEWPLVVSQYRTAASLAEKQTWVPGDPPVRGQAPVSIAGHQRPARVGPEDGPRAHRACRRPRSSVMNEFLAILDTLPRTADRPVDDLPAGPGGGGLARAVGVAQGVRLGQAVGQAAKPSAAP